MFVLMDVKSLDIYRGFPKTLDIYHGFRKRVIFTAVLENTQFSTYVKPYLLDIYRRFETYTENCPLKKLWHRKGFCTLDPCFIDIYRKHPYIHFDVTIRFWRFFVDFQYFVGVCHAFWPCGGPKSVRLGTLCAFRRVSMYVRFAP